MNSLACSRSACFEQRIRIRETHAKMIQTVIPILVACILARPHESTSIPNFSSYCADIIEYPLLNFGGGHDYECFKKKPISFAACQQLLIVSLNCSALTYHDSLCWLHNRLSAQWRSSPRFNEIFPVNKSFRAYKLLDGVDECLPKQLIGDPLKNAVSDFKLCSYSSTIDSVDSQGLSLGSIYTHLEFPGHFIKIVVFVQVSSSQSLMITSIAINTKLIG